MKALDQIDNLIEICQPDDIFTQQNLSDIFYEYVNNRTEKASESTDCSGKVSKERYTHEYPPPWKKLNKTFESLNFRYRFSEDYERI